jgi:hypothetical protein
MSILQKRAWINLAGAVGLIVTAGIFLEVSMYINAQVHILFLLLALPVGIVAGFACYIRSISAEKKLDEREKTISRKADYCAGITFALFLAIASFGIFFVSGAKSNVPVYLLPLLVLTGIFLAQLVESATILIWCAKEQQDG